MSKVNKRINELTEDFDASLSYNIDEFHEKVYEEVIVNKRNVEIAKNMLNLDLDVDTISKATGLTFEEVNDLKKNISN